MTETAHPSAFITNSVLETRTIKSSNSYLMNIVAAQEGERKRIARDLHDILGQNLAALGMGLSRLREEIRSDFSLFARIADLEQLTSEMAQRVHFLTLELRPASLDDVGLFPSIAAFVDHFSAQYEIEADYQNSILQNISLGPIIDANLYRIVQEALTNVAKHSRCSRVDVVVEGYRGQLILLVEDNGCGFDVDNLLNSSKQDLRLGIEGMRERANLAGGELAIESVPGKGTTVIAKIPCEQLNK
ncbi:MAG: sensor histidine kinase [Cyanobacteria bacterium]|nr:sensor histidine kinase [Cyanobacteriota bacterium]